MTRQKILARSLLQLVVVFGAIALSAGLAPRPSQSLSLVITLLVASVRPIWIDFRIADRALIFVLASLFGLSVWHYIGSMADHLYSIDSLDASDAATLASSRMILAPLAAFLGTWSPVSSFTDWLIEKWRAGGVNRLGMAIALFLAPYFGLGAIAVVSNIPGLNSVYAAALAGLIATAAVFPFSTRIVYWLADRPLFSLTKIHAEGARRTGLLLGVIFGAPFSIYLRFRLIELSDRIPSRYRDDDFLIVPLVGLLGLATTYVLVHAAFWAFEGFRSKAD